MAVPQVVLTRPNGLDVLMRTYVDTAFIVGESPRILDLNTDLGRDAIHVEIVNDGAGALGVELSNDGAAFSTSLNTLNGERFVFDGLQVDQIRLTWAANSSYRVIVW